MQYRFEFRPYRRWFKHPLQTSHGSWEVREGIILRLSDKTGRTSWGEIAPLSWFGSETLTQALDFCHQLPTEITSETIFSIPATLPSCQFGFESAWEEAEGERSQRRAGASTEGGFPTPVPYGGKPSCRAGSSVGDWRRVSPVEATGVERCGDGGMKGWGARNNFIPSPPLPLPLPPSPSLSVLNDCQQLGITYSGLLPAGEAALHQWQTLWNQGYRTFKWKIGVAPIQEELNVFHQLIRALPASAQIRLDANGGLNANSASVWLQVCDLVGIEFLEQPLPVEQFDAMLELSTRYSTQLALDESVASFEQLEASYKQGWQGIFVIKPCIAGSPSRLRQFCREHEIDVVFSSVFETAIGRHAALKLASELPRHNRAVGFGISHWFDEDDKVYLQRLWKDL